MASYRIEWVMLRKGHAGLYKAPTKEERRKRMAKRREIRSSLLIFDLKDGKFWDSGKQEEGILLIDDSCNY